MGQPISSPVIGAPKTSRGGRRTPLLPTRSGWSLSRVPGFQPGPTNSDPVGSVPISGFGYLRSLLAGFATGAGMAVVIWHLF